MNVEQIVRTYIQDVDAINETPRKERFIRLLSDLFPKRKRELDHFTLTAETYIKYEKALEGTARKGFIDTLYGNLVIEFEHELISMQKEAERQLKEYVAKLWSGTQNKRSFLAIATDGVKWQLYTPLLDDEATDTTISPKFVKLKPSEFFEASHTNAQSFYEFLDRILFRDNLLKPTSKNINSEFKSGSYIHSVITDSLTKIYARSVDIKIVEESFSFWREYLKYSYGNIEGSKELYISHTYMSGFAKILVAFILSDRMNKSLSETDLPSILEGSFFHALKVRNYIEQDFFYWINIDGIKDLRFDVWRIVFNVLKTYDFKEINSDFLKDIYQNLVDPQDRHDLGEYYTPDWLCEKIVSHSLSNFSDEKEHIIADVSCGSGSFLRASINYLKEKKGILDAQTITKSVVGFDIHPLAVFIAKTNYLISLGNLIEHLDQPLHLPIYLCDSLSGPDDDRHMVSELYLKVTFMNEEYLFPRIKGFGGSDFDSLINCIHTIVYKKLNSYEASLVEHLRSKSHLEINEETFAQFIGTSIRLAQNINEKYSGIKSQLWAFILKNLHRPAFFKHKITHVVGNPPWLTFKDVESPSYKKELETLGLKKYKIAPTSSKLRTQMELATIFLCHSVNYFMKKDASIFFVMPRSIYNTDQHSELRNNSFDVELSIEELWDLEDVSPLFRTLSCVIIGKKTIKSVELKDINGVRIAAKLPEQNYNYASAKQFLVEEKVTYNIIRMNQRTAIHHEKFVGIGSDQYYIKKFKQGATIVPRNFTFVDVAEGDLNKNVIAMRTPTDIAKEAKAPYKGHLLEGLGSPKYIFKTLLANSILPFAVIKQYWVHLPIIKNIEGQWQESSIEDVYLQDKDSGEYFDKAIEKFNSLYKGDMSFFENVNYNDKLLSQNPESKYWVLYCASGTNVSATVFENNSKFWADHKTYWYCPGSLDEGYYLCGILNSIMINKAIKPFQSKGLQGERDIHKKVLDIGIPKFDSKNEIHVNILNLAEQATKKANNYYSQIKAKAIGKKRSILREHLSEDLNNIDVLVKKLFNITD